VRRHIDNLIGPPTPARPREGAQGQAGTGIGSAQAGAGGTPGPARQQGPAMTPEETAARLLRERQERNPNVFRDTLYRVERALALFLASLVPGVGERHVRAREEIRRLENEERERERATREAEQVQNTEINGSAEDLSGQTVEKSGELGTVWSTGTDGAVAEGHDNTPSQPAAVG